MLKLCSSVEAIRTTCAMAMMFTLQLKFELSTIPSIPSNGNVGGLLFLVLSYFDKTSFPFLFLAESVKILVGPHAGFPSTDYLSYRQECMFEMCFHENKANGRTFYFKIR